MNSKPIICLWALVLLTGLLSAAEYTLVDLGPGVARSVNNSGTVAGYDDSGGFTFDSNGRKPTPPLFARNATSGELIPILQLQWAGINDSGRLAGSGILTNGARFVVVWDGTGEPFVLPNVNNYGPDRTAYPVAVNSSGTVAGGSANAYPFRFLNNQFESLSGRILWVFDLNDSGVLVGGNLHFNSYQPAIWKDGVLTSIPIDIPGGVGGPITAYGTTINSSGQIAGNINLDSIHGGPFYTRGFLWTQGTQEFIDVDTNNFSGNVVYVQDLNDSGVVVGSAKLGAESNRAFIYRERTMTDLNTLIPNNGWKLSTAYSINKNGWIAGAGLVNGQPRAFLLRPTDPGLGVPPTIVSQPTQGGRFGLGESTTLTVVAHGTLPLSYQWQRNGTNLVGKTESTLALNSMTAEDTGAYQVLVSNLAGEAYSQQAVVTVLDPEVTALRFAGVSVTGAIGGLYEIQGSPGVTNQAWTPMTRITLTNSPQVWIDPASGTNTTLLFYRAIRIFQ